MPRCSGIPSTMTAPPPRGRGKGRFFAWLPEGTEAKDNAANHRGDGLVVVVPHRFAFGCGVLDSGGARRATRCANAEFSRRVASVRPPTSFVVEGCASQTVRCQSCNDAATERVEQLDEDTNVRTRPAGRRCRISPQRRGGDDQAGLPPAHDRVRSDAVRVGSEVERRGGSADALALSETTLRSRPARLDGVGGVVGDSPSRPGCERLTRGEASAPRHLTRSKTHGGRTALLGALLAAQIGCKSQPFACRGDDECGAGRCESVGYCSFPNPLCPSGWQFGAHAPPWLAERCLPVDAEAQDGSTSAATTTTATTATASTSTTGGASTSVSADADSDTLVPTASVGDATTLSATSSSSSSGALDPTTHDGGGSDGTGDSMDPYPPCPSGRDEECPSGFNCIPLLNAGEIIGTYCGSMDCDAGRDCPSPTGGNAIPMCTQLSTPVCTLTCPDGEACPAGMLCFSGSSGATACAWGAGAP